jgi:hypothetical protein
VRLVIPVRLGRCVVLLPLNVSLNVGLAVLTEIGGPLWSVPIPATRQPPVTGFHCEVEDGVW